MSTPQIDNRQVSDGKAAFYACIMGDLKDAAYNCGWALGLHGSLLRDMDIMAMPWTEDAQPAEVMIKALSDRFTDNPYRGMHIIPRYSKPHRRVVYSMRIYGDYYLDISVMR